jgi:hypothetical protein
MDEDIEAMQSNLFSMNVARLYSHQSRASWQLVQIPVQATPNVDSITIDFPEAV